MTFKKRSDYLNYLKNRSISIENKKRWTDDFLEKTLSKKFFIIKLKMPCKENAKYIDWKIHFDRYKKYIDKNTILIGISLGGIFLAKYLSENKIKKVLSTYLICPPYDNSLSNEDLVGGFKLGKDLSLLEKNTKNLYLMFSKDDPIVHVSHAYKYQKKLSKKANIIIYKSKNGHFRIQKFKEIVDLINKDIKS